MPQVFEDALWMWNAWSALHRCRAAGFTVGPIPLTEVVAYCQIHGVRKPDVLAHVIQEMDVVYLQHAAEKARMERDRQRARAGQKGR